MSAAATRVDVVVVGGGPAGATAATELARAGCRVALLERGGRIKPCGGAVPPRLLEEFHVPPGLLATTVKGARIVSPAGRRVDMPIENGFVGMVEREVFDEWLRQRAVSAGAWRRNGTYRALERERDGTVTVRYTCAETGTEQLLRARCVVGADGARSRVARDGVPGSAPPPCVAAYHEIVAAPPDGAGAAGFDPLRCDVYYQGGLSPDFYAWVFPHGETVSVGVGSACKGFSLRQAVRDLRRDAALEDVATLRREGAPIPLRPRKRWDNGRDVVLAGDAAGVVAPASGEGIYYAMCSARLVAQAVATFLASGDARALATARRRFARLHGRVFWVLGMMQRFWYSSDRRRERFVSMCGDADVQRLTWEAYMHKRLVRARPAAHVRIFFKDLAHLMGIVPP